ncbi:MAG: caspase family protein [Pseudomonadota bacterium]
MQRCIHSKWRILVSLTLLSLVGCVTAKPNVDIPSPLPDAVAQYHHMTLYAGTTGLVSTGIQLREGDLYSVLATGKMNFCPKGGCSSQLVTPEQGWPLVGRVGDTPYLQVLPDNTNAYTRTLYHPAAGELFIGYKAGSLRADGYPDNPDWYANDSGQFSVDIIVWNTKDRVQIANFIENLVARQPGNAALTALYRDFSAYRKIELAKAETSKAIESTKKELNALIVSAAPSAPSAPDASQKPAAAQEAKAPSPPPGASASPLPPPLADPMKTAPPVVAAPSAIDAQKTQALETKLAELTAMMAKLETMEKELAAEKEKTQEMSSTIDAYAQREKTLQSQLADGTKAPPVVVIAEPADRSETVAARIVLAGVVEDEAGIRQVDVTINGKPIEPESGRGIVVATAAQETPRRRDIRHDVGLTTGENRITVRVTDTDGMETERTVIVTRQMIRKNIWAAVVGIDAYTAARPLQYAAKDATAFYRYLVEQNGVPKENVFLLLNAEANLGQLRSVLGTTLKRKAAPEDTVIIYFAGHGATERDPTSPDGDGLEKYLLPVDADPTDLYASALPMREIAFIFERIRAERLIFIADACYSGASGGRTLQTGGLRAGISEKFLDRISSGKGRVILTASNANEVSAESPEFGHGVFTYYLLQALSGAADTNRDGLISVDEVYAFVSAKVPSATGQDQHPVKKGSFEGQLYLGVKPE